MPFCSIKPELMNSQRNLAIYSIYVYCVGDLRSASRAAPGFVASKSPPSAARPDDLTCSSLVASFLLFVSSAPARAGLFSTGAFAETAVEESVSAAAVAVAARAALPPCSLASSSTGRGPLPVSSSRGLPCSGSAMAVVGALRGSLTPSVAEGMTAAAERLPVSFLDDERV
jgi:hypothetical protein